MRVARGLLFAAVACAVASSALADWDTDASISVGSYYSDNICLVPRNEEGEPVGTVTPGVQIRGGGARSTTSLSAAVEYNTLGDSSLECPQGGVGLNPQNREAFVPRVTFLQSFEAVENLLFLEADASAFQNAINPFASGADDNINGTGNTNISYRWGVGARLERQFNESWAMFARYGYNEQYNSVNRLIGDSQEDRFEFDFGKIPGVSRFAYGIRGQYNEITFDGSADRPEFTNRLSRAEFRVALQLSREWQVNTFAGQEDNVFISNSDEIDGSYWDVGIQWTPNERVTVGVGSGERFFGSTPRFNLSYRHRRSEISAFYSRDLQFPRNIRAPQPSLSDDDFLDPFPDIPVDADPVGGPTFIGQSPTLNEQFSLSYQFTGRRTTLRIGASRSQQTRVRDGSQGDFESINIGVTRAIARRLSLQLRAEYINNEGSLGDDIPGSPQFFRGRTTWRGSVGLSRSLSDQTSVVMRYRYTDQEAEQTNATFEENRVELSLNHRF